MKTSLACSGFVAAALLSLYAATGVAGVETRTWGAVKQLYQTSEKQKIGSAALPSISSPSTLPQTMADFKWPWIGISQACGGEQWYIYSGYTPYGGSAYHYGRDYYAVDLHVVGEGSAGHWVLNPAMGVVSQLGDDPSIGLGYYVRMDHGSGWESVVGHLQSNPAQYLRVGDILLQGTFLGYCGTTGNSTGPHVHFSIRRYNQAQPLAGISGYGSIVRGWAYWSGNAYVSPPRNFRP